MANTITTVQTSSITSDIVNPILIDQTETTRRVLLAKIVDNPKDPTACISGTIVHQRKNKSGLWENAESIKLNTLKGGEGVQMNFSCSQMKSLKQAIEKAYAIGAEGVVPSGRYVIGTEDEIIKVDGRENEYIKALLNKNLGEDIWTQLVESNPDLATKLSLAKIQSDRMSVVGRFEKLLSGNYNEKYWQKFFADNDWIFGYGLSYIFTTVLSREVYVGGKNINNTGGSVSDFMAASQGDARFTVLIEIKKPDTPLIASEDRNNSYPISQELAKAIAQIQCYCQTWGENLTRELTEYEIDQGLTHTTPKGIVLIGDTKTLKDKYQKRSFELFREGLRNVEIITYDELLARAQFIVQKGQLPQQDDHDELPF